MSELDSRFTFEKFGLSEKYPRFLSRVSKVVDNYPPFSPPLHSIATVCDVNLLSCARGARFYVNFSHKINLEYANGTIVVLSALL